MSKTIIHQKLPTTEHGSNTMPYKTIKSLHDNVQNIVGEDYIVITTPTELNVLDGDAKIFMIEAKYYSYNELKEMMDRFNKEV